jgi:hypothetical protein
MQSLYTLEALESRVLLSVPAPTDLVVVSRTETTIGLHWTEPPGAITGFHLFESGDGIGAQVTLPPGQTSYLATGLDSSRAYNFRITAFDAAGDSIAASVSSGTLHAVPTAPSYVAETAAGLTSVKFTWIDNSGDADGFKIQRNENPFDASQNFTTIATLPATARSYTDRTAPPGAKVAYRIIAFNPVFQAPAAEGVLVTLPVKPADFTVAGVSGTSFLLQWNGLSQNSATDSFTLQQSAHGRWRTITHQNTFGNAHSFATPFAYTVTGLTPATRYSFRIFANNSFGTSSRAASLRARTSAASSAIPAPTALGVVATAPGLAMLRFQDASPAIDHFIIESLDETNIGTSWKAEGVTSASHSPAMASYLVTGLMPGIKYDFRVTAVNGYSVSAPASIVFTMPTYSPLAVTLPSGKVVAAFNNTTYSYTETGAKHWIQEVGVSRTNPDGTPDVNFGVGGRVVLETYVNLQGDGSLRQVLVKPDGSIYAVDFKVTNISSDGRVLASTGLLFNSPLAMTHNGELLVINNGGNTPDSMPDLTRYRPDLTVDPTFGNAGVLSLLGYDSVSDLSVLSNGLTALTMDSNRVVLLDTAGNVLPFAPATPSNLTAEQVGGKVTLHFTDNSTDETGFVVQTSLAHQAFFGYTVVPASTGAGRTVTFDAGSFVPNDDPAFRVYAIKGSYRSAASNFVQVSIP